MYSILIVCILSYVLLCANALHDSANGRRGIARMMNVTSGLAERDRITWYNGPDLKAAACFGRNGMPEFDAEESYMIGAMAMHSFEQCFKCVQLTNNKDTSKKIVVQVIDKCAACKFNTHIDLTPAAFRKLAPKGNLRLGILDVSFKPVSCPSGGIFDIIRSIKKHH